MSNEFSWLEDLLTGTTLADLIRSKTPDAVAVLSFVISIASAVLLAVALWRLFTKAGEKGWKSLIPVLNVYTLYKIAWDTGAFWRNIIYLLLIIAAHIVMIICGFVVDVVCAACIIALLLARILNRCFRLQYHLSKSFGHGFWYSVGLVLFPDIFYMILGLGKSKWRGAKW